MTAKDDSNSKDVQKDARTDARKIRLESSIRKKSIAETKSNFHLRELDGKPARQVKGERSSASLATTHAVSNAVTELYWRSSSARKIDLSKELERGLPTTNKSGERLYILGAEFAITAIVAAVAIARRRADMSSATLPSVSKLKSEAEKEKHFSMVKIILKDDPDCEKPGCTSATDSGAQDLVRTGTNVVPADANSEQAKANNAKAAERQNEYLYGSSTSRPTVIITGSDTLVSIAQRQYHDGNVGWLIADLNGAKVKEKFEGNKRVVEVADGELLELPIWKEIVAFYQRKEDGACAENLITIVSRPSMDREIVDAVLSPIVDPPKDD